MIPISTVFRSLVLALTCVGVTACGTGDRLKDIGKAPALSAIENPTAARNYRPVQMPMPTPRQEVFEDNSLWRTGSRSFFKDQRARRRGDILTILVAVTDSAQVENSTERKRSNNEDLGAGGSLGNKVLDVIGAGTANAAALVDLQSSNSSAGEGKINRRETLTTKIAAVVTQVLPNGNLVLEGRQEIRVNFEVREMIVAGIVRPEDIAADNTVESSKIAEARISYGGRGQISDVQQPRYGQQVLDVLLPF
ncbi:MAG: flagellar basal body L-ring protein FlgH [Pseudomonadota bacterium]